MNLATHVNKNATTVNREHTPLSSRRPPSRRGPDRAEEHQSGCPTRPSSHDLGTSNATEHNAMQRNGTQRPTGELAQISRARIRRVLRGTRLTGARGSSGDVPAVDTRRLYTDRQSMDRLRAPRLAVNKQDEIEPFSSPPSAVYRDKEASTHGASLNSTLGRSQSNRRGIGGLLPVSIDGANSATTGRGGMTSI